MDAEVKTEPALKLNFLSHGTLESKDLERSRKFFEEFLGCDVIRTSPISLLIRLGGEHTYAVVEQKKRQDVMGVLYHNGFDVETQEEVENLVSSIDLHSDNSKVTLKDLKLELEDRRGIIIRETMYD